jgi:hypothetical protein
VLGRAQSALERGEVDVPVVAGADLDDVGQALPPR